MVPRLAAGDDRSGGRYTMNGVQDNPVIRARNLLAFFILVFVCTAYTAGQVRADDATSETSAGFVVPSQTATDALFIVELQVPAGSPEQPVRLSFDPVVVQFVGAVTPTSVLQMKGVSELEIRKSGTQNHFRLKFLRLQEKSVLQFHLQDGPQQAIHVVNIEKIEEQGSLRWLVLFGALVLLLVAGYLWRWQKKAPELMSTRSLFFSFEELQKLRQKYGENEVDAIANGDGSTQTAGNQVPGQGQDLGQGIKVVLRDRNNNEFTGIGREVTIGRNPGQTIILTGSEISRKHARIFHQNDVFFLQAVSTSTTTEVNGLTATKQAQQLKEGDSICLGGIVLVISALHKL